MNNTTWLEQRHEYVLSYEDARQFFDLFRDKQNGLAHQNSNVRIQEEKKKR
jgi:hypothetical protein